MTKKKFLCKLKNYCYALRYNYEPKYIIHFLKFTERKYHQASAFVFFIFIYYLDVEGENVVFFDKMYFIHSLMLQANIVQLQHYIWTLVSKE